MTDRVKREHLVTEQQNVRSMEIDSKSVAEILQIINAEDKEVAPAVQEVLPQVERVVEYAVERIRKGGRVFYLGAGTSGRLGVLDSSEIPPTFSAPRGMFRGIIAGGDRALRQSIEGAEDRAGESVKDLEKAGLESKDVLIGIATSSTTPYVLKGLEYGRSLGCRTVFLICNPAPLEPVDVDVLVAIDVGKEVITGSTRMKSGTATKLVLNMISTATMVRLGKVYGNLMVDLKAVSQKLVDRATRIVAQLTSLSYEEAGDLLEKAHREAKPAIVMHHRECSYEEAVRLLKQHSGFLRPIVEEETGRE